MRAGQAGPSLTRTLTIKLEVHNQKMLMQTRAKHVVPSKALDSQQLGTRSCSFKKIEVRSRILAATSEPS